MAHASVRHLAMWAVVTFLAPLPLAAAQGESAYDVEEDHAVSLRALLDVRVVRQGPQPSWLEGGPGKTRYGGVVENGQAETIARFALSQFALQPSVALPWGVRFEAQLNWDVDIDVDGGFGAYSKAPLLVEGFFRKEWGGAEDGWALQAGVMTPAFSLENTGPAWTPTETLSLSAANSWLWEEVLPVGLEGEWWRTTGDGFQLGAFGGMGWGPDRLGTLLAQRGWVLSDFLSGVNSTLPNPATGKEVQVFDEEDGRPALYGGVTASDPSRIAELRLGYFDNLGNLAVGGVWHTRFGEAGVRVQPLAGLEILMQGTLGHTTTGGKEFESRFGTWYPLVSYRYGGQRLSVRYDNFHVSDLDGPPSSTESGYAVTAAYLFEFWLRHRIGFEYIYVDSERPGATPSHMVQSGWQLSYRFRY